MSIHLVYVTGAYSRETSAGRAKNIEAAKSAAWEIVGFLPDWYPVTPHIEGAVRVRHFATLPVDNLLPKCDALLVVGSSRKLAFGGKLVPASRHVKQEIEIAVSQGIPVFYDIEDFKAEVLFDARTESNPKGETGMKTIKYMGREYEVPDWAKFIATDEDGPTFVFSHKPGLYGNVWLLAGLPALETKWARVGGEDGDLWDNWKDSLVEIK